MRFIETYLGNPSEGVVDKTRKIHDDYIHDFVFDDGHITNFYGEKPRIVATIFSFAANEKQDAIGEIQNENIVVSAMNSNAIKMSNAAIADEDLNVEASKRNITASLRREYASEIGTMLVGVFGT